MLKLSFHSQGGVRHLALDTTPVDLDFDFMK